MQTPTSPVNFACAARRERRDLLVARLHELELVADLVEGADAAR